MRRALVRHRDRAPDGRPGSRRAEPADGHRSDLVDRRAHHAAREDHLGRSHTVHVGVEASGGSARTQAGFSGLIGERVDGVPARVWQYNDTGRDSLWSETGVVLYASDRFELLPRLQVDLGIRFEAVAGSAADSANPIRWTDWLPRVASLGGHRRLRSRGLRRVPDATGTSCRSPYFSFGDDAGQTGRVYRWNATSAAGPPLPGQVGELIARVGPARAGIRSSARSIRPGPPLSGRVRRRIRIEAAALGGDSTGGHRAAGAAAGGARECGRARHELLGRVDSRSRPRSGQRRGRSAAAGVQSLARQLRRRSISAHQPRRR